MTMVRIPAENPEVSPMKTVLFFFISVHWQIRDATRVGEKASISVVNVLT